jgi:hypothetical protein
MNKTQRFGDFAVLAVAVLLVGSAIGQTYFTPVENTGEYSTIVIQNATINNVLLVNGDEIGVFDGALCVGAVVYGGVFPISCPGVMAYSPPSGDPLPGAVYGNPITFRLWQNSTQTEIIAIPTFVSGGNFGDVLTVVNPLQGAVSSVDDPGASVPDGFFLTQNFPNPFNPNTQISFGLPESSDTRIEIFNVKGERIRLLLDRKMAAGIHTAAWDGKNDKNVHVDSGLYLLRIQAGEYSKTRQIHLVQ